MKVIYHPEASDDLQSSAVYYEASSEGLGIRFLDAVTTAIKQLEAFPHLGKLDQAGYRILRVRGFPFNLLYKPFPDYLFIVAVAHQSRKHGYWKDRR